MEVFSLAWNTEVII